MRILGNAKIALGWTSLKSNWHIPYLAIFAALLWFFESPELWGSVSAQTLRFLLGMYILLTALLPFALVKLFLGLRGWAVEWRIIAFILGGVVFAGLAALTLFSPLVLESVGVIDSAMRNALTPYVIAGVTLVFMLMVPFIFWLEARVRNQRQNQRREEQLERISNQLGVVIELLRDDSQPKRGHAKSWWRLWRR